MSLDIIIALVCILCSACFSGFENGIIAIRKVRLDHAVAQGSRSARLIKTFLQRPAIMMATILLGNNLVNSLSAIYLDKLASELLSESLKGSLWMAVLIALVVTLILLVVGEITPKMWFRQRPLPRTQLLIYPMYGFSLVVWPFVRAITVLSHLLNHLMPAKQHHQEAAMLREEFRVMLVESEEANLLDTEARRLLDNALSYTHRTVHDVLTPTKDVKSLTASMTLREAVDLAQKVGFSRFPVRRGLGSHGGDWIGVFSIYDALYKVDQRLWDQELVLGHIRPLVSISERAGIDQVLPKITLNRAPLLAVMDRQGKPVGVVTAEDVVQPLFGDITG
jgi:putative hemolysin